MVNSSAAECIDFVGATQAFSPNMLHMLAVPLMYSSLIISILVTPKQQLKIRTFKLCSLSFSQNHCHCPLVLSTSPFILSDAFITHHTQYFSPAVPTC